MALSAMLSAIRTLILDHDPPQGAEPERREELARRFPGLTSDELDDLAAIPPPRLRVYSETIFAGERGLLEWACPVSLAAVVALRQAQGDARDAGELGYEVVREMHRFRPWRRASVRELAANFQDWLGACGGSLTRAWPGLLDLVDYERTDTDVYYAADPPHQPFTPADTQGLAGLSVEELLAQPLVRPGLVALRRYAYDVPRLWAHRRREGRFPAPWPGCDRCVLVCGRDLETFQPCWLRLDAAGEMMFDRAPAETTVTVNELACAFLAARSSRASASTGEASEEELFAAFFRRLADWMKAGVLMRPAGGGAP
jgi:hypothetical protein